MRLSPTQPGGAGLTLFDHPVRSVLLLVACSTPARLTHG
jgi:hypothetical protein